MSEELKEFRHRKPDIILIYPVRKSCKIMEITLCYDVYIDFAFNNKCEREPVQKQAMQNGSDCVVISNLIMANYIWGDTG